VLILPRG